MVIYRNTWGKISLFGQLHTSRNFRNPQYMSNGEVAFTSPPTITLFPDYGPDPFSISQTVTGLVPGGVYRMSFWVSGEWSNLGFATSTNGTTAGDGIMGVQI